MKKRKRSRQGQPSGLVKSALLPMILGCQLVMPVEVQDLQWSKSLKLSRPHSTHPRKIHLKLKFRRSLKRRNRTGLRDSRELLMSFQRSLRKSRDERSRRRGKREKMKSRKSKKKRLWRKRKKNRKRPRE